ncbi:MAG TPA: hypothetical protein VM911_14585 [Pyrinomonadaceae bacterium]|jgi:hypothetical protein|nr:hypothetical protein [Pyrinomonadaceae bacterium]
MPTDVTLLLKGSLVLFAKEGQTVGTVRILRVPPPNHVLTIKYQIQPPGGAFGNDIDVPSIQDALLLDVQSPSNPNITLRGKNDNVDRKQPLVNPHSVRWFVDLENSELYDGPIGAKKSAFKQVLTFNSGELFNDAGSDNPSYNPLLYQKGSNSNYEDFGFVAIRIGVLFSMAGRVIFKNGNNVVFDSDQHPAGTNFRIKLDHDATTHPALSTDANHYYKAVGSGIPPEERILFASIKEDEALRAILNTAKLREDSALVDQLEKLRLDPPAGPEAACFPAYISRTEP